MKTKPLKIWFQMWVLKTCIPFQILLLELYQMKISYIPYIFYDMQMHIGLFTVLLKVN